MLSTKSNVFRFCCLLCLAVFSLPVFSQDASVEFKKIQIPMSDGVKLAAHLFLPKEQGAYPVLLMRSPYGKGDEKQGEGNFYAKNGYAVVIEDTRGKFESEGVWEPFRYDGKDGFDTQEWIGSQPWCNGKIGTFGGSYVGFTQWVSSPYESKFLKAMAPGVPFCNAYKEITYIGGAFQLSLAMGWGLSVSTKPGESLPKMDWNQAFATLPLKEWDKCAGREVGYLRDWVAHSTYDDFWKARGIDDRFADITVPILNVGGWYDIFSKATLEQVNRVRHESKDVAVRRNQFAIIGPWGHGIGSKKTGELDFGDKAKMDFGPKQFQWFEYWLKGKDSGVGDWPPYYLFIMGENVWRSEYEWPLKRTEFTKYYIHSEGKSNTVKGNGRLNTVIPNEEKSDTFIYDASNPVPTTGGNNLVGPAAGPLDQQKVEERDDVLVFTADTLDKAVEVTGPVKMVLYASSSAKDTDFTAKLVDVHPDGKAYNLCDGIIRARYRESITEPTLIEPGKIYKYDIDLWVTANVFLPGHKIRVEISSSNYPRFDRNPNSGKPFGSDTELLKATQLIYHDAKNASYIELPVIPR